MSLALKLAAALGGASGGGGDPDFANVSCLLHFDENYIDVKGKTWTARGFPTNNTGAKYGSGALYTDANGEGVDTPSHTDFDFGTGDFTIEFWHDNNSPGGSSYRVVIMRATSNSWSSGWVIYCNISGGLTTYGLWAYNGDRTSTAQYASGYHHIALVRASGVWTFYVDGAATGTPYNNGSQCDSGNVVSISADPGVSSYNSYGYFDDVRITKGVARYTANFTAPIAAFPDS